MTVNLCAVGDQYGILYVIIYRKAKALYSEGHGGQQALSEQERSDLVWTIFTAADGDFLVMQKG